jgi:hypothetical protein
LECGRALTLDGLECIVSAACASSGSPRFVLFGRELQADGVFFVVDRSGSMADQGELALAKREISTAIAGFPETVEFGIVLFDTLVESYPSTGFPARADPVAKLEAAGFIESMLPGSGSCCLPGFVAGLEFAARSKAERKALIYIGDGGGSCQGAHDEAYLRQALAKIEALNTHGVEIHCMAILNVASKDDEFLRRLAWDNEGSYTVVPK